MGYDNKAMLTKMRARIFRIKSRKDPQHKKHSTKKHSPEKINTPIVSFLFFLLLSGGVIFGLASI